MISKQKEQAEIFRHLLAAGFIKVEDVISWADSIIVKEREPDFEIIEISLSSSKPKVEVTSLLHKVKGDYNSVDVIRKSMVEIHKVLVKEPIRGYEIAKWLIQLAESGELPEDEFNSEPYGILDSFDLARNKIYGTEQEASSRLIIYLQEQINKISE
ncbi:MAG TPA: hypothetical protein VLH59_00010 [Ignavibacteriaceae bacterium]|nr:hypothetical protein [Ignavibacteriaceae bacterium]